MIRCLLVAFMVGVAFPAFTQPAADTPFRQETARVIGYPAETPGDARSVASTPETTYVGFTEGALALDVATGAWSTLADAGLPAMPVFAILPVDKAVYFATGVGLYVLRDGKAESVLETELPLSTLALDGDDLLAAGPRQLWRVRRGKAKPVETGELSRGVNAVTVASNGKAWLATGMGLYRLDGKEAKLYQAADEIISSYVYDVLPGPDGRIWAAGLGGISIYEGDQWVGRIEPVDGLPNAWALTLARDTDGGMWVGTELGAARFDGKRWSVRHSRRWLADLMPPSRACR